MSQTRERYFEWTLLGLILIFGVILFYEALPFLNGALGAITLYILLRRTNIYLSRRISPRAAPWIITLAVTLFVLLPLSAILWYIIDLVQNVNIDVQVIVKRFTDTLQHLEQVTHFDLMSERSVSFITARATGIMNMFMSGINNTAINLFTAILLLFFLLSGGMKMERVIARCLPFNDNNKRAVIYKISTIVRSNAIGIPLLALIQGGVAAVGYTLCEVKNPIEFGALTGFASMIPIVGSMLVWIPLAIFQYFEQGTMSAIYVAAYGALIISQCDNVLRMILQKRMANTHPLITIFGVIAGLPLFGFMGLIFGPLMVAMFLLFLEMFVNQYIIGSDIEPAGRKKPSINPLFNKLKARAATTATCSPASAASTAAATSAGSAGSSTSTTSIRHTRPTRAESTGSTNTINAPHFKSKNQQAVQNMLQRGKTQAQNRAAMYQSKSSSSAKGPNSQDAASPASSKSIVPTIAQDRSSTTDSTPTSTVKSSSSDIAASADSAASADAAVKNAHSTQGNSSALKTSRVESKAAAAAPADAADAAHAAVSADTKAAAVINNALVNPEKVKEENALAVESKEETKAGPRYNGTTQANTGNKATAKAKLPAAAASSAPAYMSKKKNAKSDFKNAKAESKHGKREAAKLRAYEELQAKERDLARATLQMHNQPTLHGLSSYPEVMNLKGTSHLVPNMVSRAVSQELSGFEHLDTLDMNAHLQTDPELMSSNAIKINTRPKNQISNRAYKSTLNESSHQSSIWGEPGEKKKNNRNIRAEREAQHNRERNERSRAEQRAEHSERRNKNKGQTEELGSQGMRNLGSAKASYKDRGKAALNRRDSDFNGSYGKERKTNSRNKNTDPSNYAGDSHKRKRLPRNLDYQVMDNKRGERKSQEPVLQTIVSHKYGGAYEAPRTHSHLRTQLISVHTAKGTMMNTRRNRSRGY